MFKGYGQMQSNELIGIRDAALIPPNMPGAAYCNDGQRTTPFLCSAVRDVDRLIRNINTAARFHACKRPVLLFPISRPACDAIRSVDHNGPAMERNSFRSCRRWRACTYRRSQREPTEHRHYRRLWQRQNQFAAALRTLLYDTGRANIRFTRKSEHGMVTDDGRPSPLHERTIWIVDDADEPLNPFSTSPEANELREALANPNITVIAATEKPTSALLDRCPTVWHFPAENVPMI